MRYVAYGEHLHPIQLLDEIESTRFVGTSELIGWTLRFNAVGADRSGKCTLEPSAASVHVAVYEIAAPDVRVLEKLIGSAHQPMQVDLGAQGQGVTYVAPRSGRDVAPFDWYRELVLMGARYHRFPQTYLDRIENQRTQSDPDHLRRARMESLLSRAQQQLPPRRF